MANREDDSSWRKNADTHKMSSETVKAAGVEGSKRPPGHNPGEILHQQRRLPFSYTTMTLVGFAITTVIGYAVLYSKKKPEADAVDVAEVAVNVPKDTSSTPSRK